MGSPENLSADDTGTEDIPLYGSDAEEQDFLIGLYRFMKERKTPIERLPHLGFKQINLWRLHQVAEKMGGYQQVTGRRLWKNVYNELGGSPGSTSAATCTRRHYERLVLPYTQYLRGEDDKPLLFPKPRKKCKALKNDKGKEAVEHTKTNDRAGNDEELLTEMKKPESHLSPVRENSQQTMPAKQPDSCHDQDLNISGDECCCNLPHHYDLLFTSMHFKEQHGILSPLAKKKLLAQVSKDLDVHSRRHHSSSCSEAKKAKMDGGLCNFSTTEKGMVCQSVICKIQEEARSCSGESSLEPTPTFSHSLVDACSESKSQSSNHSFLGVDATLPRTGSCATVFSGYFEVYKGGQFNPTEFRTIQDAHKRSVASHAFPDQLPGSCVSKAKTKEGEEPMKTVNGGSQHSSESFRHNPPLFRCQKACCFSPVISSARSQFHHMPSPQLPKIRDTGKHTNPIKSYSPVLSAQEELDKTDSEQGRKFNAIHPFLKEGGNKEYPVSRFCKSPPQVIHKPKAIKPCLGCGPSLTGNPVKHKEGIYPSFSMSVHQSMELQKSLHSSPSPLSLLRFNPIILSEFPGHMRSVSPGPSDPYRLLTSAAHQISYPNLLHERQYPLHQEHISSTYITPHMPTLYSKTEQ